MNIKHKKSAFGKLPNGWKIGKLSDLGELFGGYAFKSKSFLSNPTDNTLQVLKMGNVKMGRLDLQNNPAFIDKDNLIGNTDKYILSKGDILISLTGTIGKTDYGNVSVINEDNTYLLNQRVACFRNKSSSEVKSYYYYYMQSSVFRHMFFLLGVGGTGNQANVSTQELSKLRAIIPSLSEQHKIASILSTWDKAIELKEKLIEQKKEQKKGLMQKLLTGEVRLPGFDGEWKEIKLNKLVKRVKGKAVKYVENGKYPAIDMEYFGSGVFKNYSNDATVFAKKTDVLLLWDGSRAGMSFTGVEGAVGSTFVKLERKNSTVNNLFLQKHLEMNESIIQRLREGSGIPHVPKDFLNIYKVLLPCFEEQNEIASILDLLNKDLSLMEKEIQTLKTQKKGLMQLLLTGKVRVKV